MALDSSCFQRLLLALAVTFRGAERLTWGWGRSGLGKGPSVHRGQWLKALSWGGDGVSWRRPWAAGDGAGGPQVTERGLGRDRVPKLKEPRQRSVPYRRKSRVTVTPICTVNRRPRGVTCPLQDVAVSRKDVISWGPSIVCELARPIRRSRVGAWQGTRGHGGGVEHSCRPDTSPGKVLVRG